MRFGRATYPVQRLPVVIPIGIQTETGVEEIAFDVSAWLEKWPDIEVEVWHRLPGQAEAYLTKSRREDNIVYWEVSSTDTQTPGMGKVELMGVLPDGRKLSGSTDTRIRETICASTQDPPDAPPTWVDTVREMVGGVGTIGEHKTLPIVFIDGEIPTTKTETLAELTYRQGNDAWHAYLKIKCQGTSSMSYPKKNFTIKMYEDEARTKKKKVAFDISGKKRSKYVLKANYMDHVHARNIVSARLWSEVVASRPDYSSLPAEMRGSPNNGAVDGFPILVYTNGQYQGIYTWNIGKDADLWGMDEDNPDHVLLCAETNDNGEEIRKDNPCNFRALWDGVDGYHWSVEVGRNSDAVKDSLNALIACVMDTDDDTFRAQIGEHLDVQAAIDYYIFSYAICGIDNLAKNMLLATYDGKRWIPGMYDMDSTWGLYWDGSKFIPATTDCPSGYQNTGSLLWEKIVRVFEGEIRQRKIELRETVLSDANILTHFERFAAGIGRDVYADDIVVYPDIPSAGSNNIWQIRNFVKPRMAVFDAWLEDGNILYELASPLAVDGNASNAVNTGVKLFARDMDFTIAIDAVATRDDWDGTAQSLLECHEQPSPWKGMSVYRNRLEHDTYTVRSIFAGGQVEIQTSVSVDTDARIALVIRHVAGSGEYVITSSTGGETSTYTMENVYEGTVGNNLWIGCADGDWDPKRAFGGTINRCIIRGDYLSDDKVRDFIAGIAQ